jgi:RNA polymerase sigma factor (sigma-70 family)
MSDGQLLERFLARRDEAAFECLVRRHGPIVLRVCRDVLPDPHEAEDAFQATFLVLVRNAGTIRDPESLGRWLYEVASRVALRARAHAARRQAQERQGVEMVPAVPGFDAADRELKPLLHEELGRLPEKFRAPLVLCYLEGLTYEEAARRLHCPLGTLKARLTRGRELLRSRLSRRGVAVTMLLLLMVLSEESLAVPPALIDSTVRTGMEVTAGGAAPARLAALAGAAAATVAARPLLAILGAIALVVGLGGVLARRSGATPAPPPGKVPVSAAATALIPSLEGVGCHATPPAEPTAPATAAP